MIVLANSTIKFNFPLISVPLPEFQKADGDNGGGKYFVENAAYPDSVCSPEKRKQKDAGNLKNQSAHKRNQG